MGILLTSDIHLNLNPIDSHRWNLLPWLSLGEVARASLAANTLIILGDLTDSKDKHSAVLVNKFVRQLEQLSKEFHHIYLLAGNHDYFDPKSPFFEFVTILTGVSFINTIGACTIDNKNCLFLPATKTPEEDWKDIDFTQYDYIFCHQTFNGAVTNSGLPLTGVDPAIFGDTNAEIFSGDIHTPMQIKGTKITYVGAPYRTSFGDTYKPRIIVLNNDGSLSNLVFPCVNKHLLTVSTLKDLRNLSIKVINFPNVNKGDLVKVRVQLDRSELPTYKQLKKEIEEYVENQGWVLHGIEPEVIQAHKSQENIPKSAHAEPSELVKRFANAHNLTRKQEAFGLELLKEAS